ncbi:reverse transcriptase domain-containing protein [Tanacetum coccineum]
MDDEPMWAADHVVAPTPGSTITIPETANEFAIKVAKNHQASIQNLKTKFDRLADKQSGRSSGSLPSNTQPNPKGHNSKACSFMLCDLYFWPSSLSLSSMPSCDLVSLTNMLILCLILKASNQSLRKSLSLNLEVAFDLLRDALSAIFGLSELKSSDDDNDDDVEKDEEDEEEEEHLAPADPSAVPTDDPAGITEFAAALPSSSPPPENVESLKDNIRETMTTVDQGMSVEEIERVVAQRVANAIEAIAIYETKTNMARKSMSQTKQQECKVAENANNKRKWEGNHNGKGTVKGGNCKKVGHITRECRNPTAARNQQTHTCYECGSLRHFKSTYPIVKFQKYVNKKISTLSECQAENKRKLNNTSKNNQN